MILSIRTDQDEARIGLTNSEGALVAQTSWIAGRQLSSQLLERIQGLLKGQQLDWAGLSGVTVFTGPGSFTGLRIGVTVANTMAYSLSIPIVGENGEDWEQRSALAIKDGRNDGQVIPAYGREPNITKPRRAGA